MRPCDCRDQQDLQKLNETGIGFNDESIEAHSNSVVLNSGSCSMRISKLHFKLFAKWYLEDQDKIEGK